jgi:periplasmic mercuric ion binding protein
MKTVKLFAVIVLLLAFAAESNGQNGSNGTTSKSETFKVYGECNMCKDRIEKTVKTEGATNASWDVKTKMLSVTIDPSKTSVDALSKKLASVGHDTEKYKAPDNVYAKLPGCCHYERAK